MKKKQLGLLLAVPGLMLAISAQAHSDKEHMKTAENPDCAAMSTMDHSKMDMKDPVVMAMMQQCMSDMQHGSKAAERKSHGHGTHMSDAGKSGEHMKSSSQ